MNSSEPARRLLVRGVNWLGDAVMTTPALRRLREAFPGSHLSLATPAKLADLWIRHPDVDAVLALEKQEGLFAVARRLRAGRYDLGIAFPNSHRAALELWLGGVRRRVGLAAPLRSWCLTQAVAPRVGAVPMHKRSPDEVRRLADAVPKPVEIPPVAHHVHHYLHLVAAVGAEAKPLAPTLAVGADEVSAVREKFGLAAGEGWIALNPGAEYGPAKRWPAEAFAAVAAAVSQQRRCRWVIVGGPADAALAELVSAEWRRLSGAPAGPAPLQLAGRTSLRELCAVLSGCGLLLTNDTGPMHLAAALGLPVVVPFGSTSPELTGPGLPGDPRHALLRHPVGCAPCFLRECPIDLRCLRGVRPDAVAEAILSRLPVCR